MVTLCYPPIAIAVHLSPQHQFPDQSGWLGQMTNIQAEAKAILESVRYWEKETHAAKILESDSLVMVKVLKGQMKAPWEIIEIVEEITQHLDTQQIIIQHIFREGNQLADYLANIASQEEKDLCFEEFKLLPKEGRQIINTNKHQIPMLRIKTKQIITPQT